MRYEMRTRFKWLLVGLLVLLSSTCFYLSYHQYSTEEFQVQTDTILEFNDKANIDYNVHLRPNKIYVNDTMNKGIIISEYIDYIDINYEYKFSCDKDIRISNNYSVYIELEGYSGTEDTYVSVFKKRYDIDESSIKMSDKDTISGTYKLNYSDFVNFVELVLEESKISVSTKLNFVFTNNVTSINDYKNIEFVTQPNFTIPLMEPYFVITNESAENKDVVEDEVSTLLPKNMKKVKIYALLGSIALVLTLLVLYFVKGINRNEPIKKAVKKIFKRHGNIMVSVNKLIDSIDKEVIQVSEMKDLVRLSDELRKPILYVNSEDLYNIREYYIYEDDTIYKYYLDIKNKKSINQYNNDPKNDNKLKSKA